MSKTSNRIPTGFIDSPFRPRDYDFGVHDLFGSAPVGNDKFLHDHAKHGLNQFGTSACTSFGVGQVVYVNSAALGVPDLLRVFPAVNGSYFQSRARKWGWENVFDVGSGLHDCWEGLLDYGMISDKDLPFDPGSINDAPLPHLYRKAADNDWLKYRWVLDPPGSRSRRIKQTLDANYALTLAVEVDESFRQWQLSHGAWFRQAPRQGSHLMALIGYEAAGAWAVNSHGPDFGEGGLILISWAYIEHPECRGFSTAEINRAKIDAMLRQ